MLSTLLCAAALLVLLAAAALVLADRTDPEPVREPARRGFGRRATAVIVYRDAVRGS